MPIVLARSNTISITKRSHLKPIVHQVLPTVILAKTTTTRLTPSRVPTLTRMETTTPTIILVGSLESVVVGAAGAGNVATAVEEVQAAPSANSSRAILQHWGPPS